MIGRTRFTAWLLILVAAVSLMTAACSNDAFGPPPVVRTHASSISVESCGTGTYSLSATWVSYDWQAEFVRNGTPATTVRNTSATKNSGCIYRSGDSGFVRLVPEGQLTQYLDPAVTGSVSFR